MEPTTPMNVTSESIAPSGPDQNIYPSWFTSLSLTFGDCFNQPITLPSWIRGTTDDTPRNNLKRKNDSR